MNGVRLGETREAVRHRLGETRQHDLHEGYNCRQDIYKIGANAYSPSESDTLMVIYDQTGHVVGLHGNQLLLIDGHVYVNNSTFVHSLPDPTRKENPGDFEHGVSNDEYWYENQNPPVYVLLQRWERIVTGVSLVNLDSGAYLLQHPEDWKRVFDVNPGARESEGPRADGRPHRE